MSLDVGRFAKAKFEHRTERVSVASLAEFFDGEDGKVDAVFIVRGLTFEELAKAENQADNSDTVRKLLEQLSSSNASVKSAALADALGYGDEVPRQMVIRKFHLITGCVDPQVDEEFAVKLANVFPVEFKILTNKILELTGLGQVVPGKH
jgi:hypothetical protein